MQILTTSVFPVLMMVAAVGDFATGRVPNVLIGIIALAFVPMAIFTGMPLDLILGHAGTGVIVFVVGTFFFGQGWFGGGDMKLLAAAALWMGWPAIGAYAVIAMFVGGGIGVLLIFHRFLFAKERTHNIPYGIALAIAAILIFPTTWWMP